MKKVLAYALKKTILNWNRPFYSKALLTVCKRYVDLYNGDNNYHRNENGELKVLKWLHSIDKLQTIVDVGANIGSYSSDVLSINPKASIDCFEPDPRAYKELSKIKGLRLHNVGVGDTEGTFTLNMGSRTTHSSLMDHGEGVATASVKVITLDTQALPKKIDLLKIDVEGFEYKVLQGAKETLKRVSFVQFEFSGANFKSRLFLGDFIEYLGQFNFQIYKIKADRLEKVSWNPTEENFALKNYLAIKGAGYEDTIKI